MGQEDTTCSEEALLLLYSRKSTSPEAEQSVPPQMRHMEKIQRKSSRQGPGTFELYPTHLTLYSSLLCLWFSFSPQSLPSHLLSVLYNSSSTQSLLPILGFSSSQNGLNDFYSTQQS